MDVPEVREEFMHVLSHYFDIKRGQEPITYVEIEAWSRMTRTPISPLEVKLLRLLDNTYHLA